MPALQSWRILDFRSFVCGWGDRNRERCVMKCVVLQPPYPEKEEKAKESVTWMIEQLDAIAPGEADLILLPEYANCPGINDKKLMRDFVPSKGTDLVDALIETAQRVNSLVASGLVKEVSKDRWVNLTTIYDASGGRIFTYEKIHLTQFERETLALSAGDQISTCEIEGVVYGFAICFDAAFPEHFVTLAKQKVDVILCPSYQRSSTPDRLDVITRARAMDTGAYMVRSSFAMPGGKTGGRSMVASPDGSLLGRLEGDAGVLRVEIDPTVKWHQPRSHGQAEIEHRELIAIERRPELYYT